MQLYARKCDWCNEGMNEGYMIHGGIEHYCSDECLFKNYSLDDWNDMYNDGDGDSCYTDWENQSDMEWILIDNKLISIDEYKSRSNECA